MISHRWETIPLHDFQAECHQVWEALILFIDPIFPPHSWTWNFWNQCHGQTWHAFPKTGKRQRRTDVHLGISFIWTQFTQKEGRFSTSLDSIPIIQNAWWSCNNSVPQGRPVWADSTVIILFLGERRPSACIGLSHAFLDPFYSYLVPATDPGAGESSFLQTDAFYYYIVPSGDLTENSSFTEEGTRWRRALRVTILCCDDAYVIQFSKRTLEHGKNGLILRYSEGGFHRTAQMMSIGRAFPDVCGWRSQRVLSLGMKTLSLVTSAALMKTWIGTFSSSL